MFNTTENIINSDCSSEDTKFYISLGINALLLLITTISEGMGASKCKSNGIIHSMASSRELLTKENSDLSNNLNV